MNGIDLYGEHWKNKPYFERPAMDPRWNISWAGEDEVTGIPLVANAVSVEPIPLNKTKLVLGWLGASLLLTMAGLASFAFFGGNFS